jgi:hypothetical protein
MRDPINWLDHVVEYPNRVRLTDLGNNLYLIERVPGEIIQQGTPVNADNQNSMDLAALQAIMMAGENTAEIRWLKDLVDAQTGEAIEVNLANTQSYPFNDSKKTVQLSKNRNRKDYTVLVEIESSTGGGVGDIKITDKLLNGFKIEYSGAATSATARCIIQGGY